MESSNLPPITSFNVVDKIGKKRKLKSKNFLDEMLGSESPPKAVAKKPKLEESEESSKIIDNPLKCGYTSEHNIKNPDYKQSGELVIKVRKILNLTLFAIDKRGFRQRLI